MDSIEREVTNYMISTGTTSPESIQCAENIVNGKWQTMGFLKGNNKATLYFLAVNSNSVQANLLQLIQSMGEYLTNDDDHVRAKGNVLGDRARSRLVTYSIPKLLDFFHIHFTTATTTVSMMQQVYKVFLHVYINGPDISTMYSSVGSCRLLLRTTH